MRNKIRGTVLGLIAAVTLSGSMFGATAVSAQEPGQVPNQVSTQELGPVPESPDVGAARISPENVSDSLSLTREQVLARARTWVDVNVKYSQTKTYTNQHGTYRTDCSGFISMAWGLQPTGLTSPNTNSLPNYGTWLNSLDDLRPGDAIDRPGTHVVMFLSWADSGHTIANVLEETSYTDAEGPDPGAIQSQWRRSRLVNEGYRPLRYNKIVERQRGHYEVGVWRPWEGQFHLRNYNGDLFQVGWGGGGDVPLAGDWNGDGRSEVGIWRPSDGQFHLRDHNGNLFHVPWGVGGDVPVTGDWNGDGSFEVGVWRPSEGKFYLRDHAGNAIHVNWGVGGDIPVTGDWNGDGKFEVGVWRPSDGQFHLRDHNGNLFHVPWGVGGDIPVTGDWNGDGSFEVGVWRPSEGRFHLRDHAGQVIHVNWGIGGDMPIAADWNGA